MMSFVSVYRCGAAPVSHRIPISVRASPNTDERKIDPSLEQVNARCCAQYGSRWLGANLFFALMRAEFGQF
jgi:hypothetical protein